MPDVLFVLVTVTSSSLIIHEDQSESGIACQQYAVFCVYFQ